MVELPHGSVLIHLKLTSQVHYFFNYKTAVFNFQEYPKNLDISHKTDLDFWDILRKEKRKSSFTAE